MNNYTASITGLSELSEPLEIGHDYNINIKASVVGITKRDNNDGTFTYKHQLRQLEAEIISDEGKTIQVKDKRSNSQKLRSQLMAIAAEKGLNEDEFYDQQMIKIRHHLPYLLEYIKTLDRMEEEE